MIGRAFRRPEVWVALILSGSYAYFWHSRDWNSATRLMLTYSIVDRGTITLDGLEKQTGDRASFRGHAYTDKLPGFSLLATVPYGLAKLAFGLTPHPLRTPAIPFWPADYWVTVFTSGLATAVIGVLLVGFARDLGCGPRRSSLVALTYGLATPAYVYATLSVGHQVAACLLFAAFRLLWRDGGRRSRLRAGLAGAFASYAAVIELAVGPVSAILGIYLLAQVFGGRRKASVVGEFAVGAVVPALVLLGYNQLAFGSPWDMGYFHHATKEFAAVHSEQNPLGLSRPETERVWGLLWGRHRGLLFYAPVVWLVPFGLAALAARKFWGAAAVSSAVLAAVFAVNVSYPEWTGGWSTGPRLLVPMLPFAMVPVAGLLGGRRGRFWAGVTAAPAVAGGVLMFLFISVGGRYPPEFDDPLFQIVLPMWRGEAMLNLTRPYFTITVPTFLYASVAGKAPGGPGWLPFPPLLAAQGLAVALAFRALSGTGLPGGSDLGVDEEQDGRRQQEDADDPRAEPQGVHPDPRPGLVPRGGVNQADGDDERQDEPVGEQHLRPAPPV